MSFILIINLLAFVGLIAILARFRKPKFSLSRQVLAGLLAGVLFGFALQFAYSDNPGAIADTLEWTNVIGTSYVNLLKMIVMPLVLVMMIAAVVKMREVAALGKIGGVVIVISILIAMVLSMVTVANAGDKKAAKGQPDKAMMMQMVQKYIPCYIKIIRIN